MRISKVLELIQVLERSGNPVGRLVLEHWLAHARNELQERDAGVRISPQSPDGTGHELQGRLHLGAISGLRVELRRS